MTHATTLPCSTCSGTGTNTHEDRHAGTNRDTCQTCDGIGTIQARTGESPEASFGFVNQNTTATDGKVFPKTGMSFPEFGNEARTQLTKAGQKLADALVKAGALTHAAATGDLWAPHLNTAAQILLTPEGGGGLRGPTERESEAPIYEAFARYVGNADERATEFRMFATGYHAALAPKTPAPGNDAGMREAVERACRVFVGPVWDAQGYTSRNYYRDAMRQALEAALSPPTGSAGDDETGVREALKQPHKRQLGPNPINKATSLEQQMLGLISNYERGYSDCFSRDILLAWLDDVVSALATLTSTADPKPTVPGGDAGMQGALAIVEAALKPFAEISPFVQTTDRRDGERVHEQQRPGGDWMVLTRADFRRAEAAQRTLHAAMAALAPQPPKAETPAGVQTPVYLKDIAAEVEASLAPAARAGDGVFRVGRKVPRHVYRGDEPLFTARTGDEARHLVDILNAGLTAAPAANGEGA